MRSEGIIPDKASDSINSLEVSPVPQHLSASPRRADRQISIKNHGRRGGETHPSKPPHPIPLPDIQRRKPSLSLQPHEYEALS